MFKEVILVIVVESLVVLKRCSRISFFLLLVRKKSLIERLCAVPR